MLLLKKGDLFVCTNFIQICRDIDHKRVRKYNSIDRDKQWDIEKY